jgi:site-specific DNA recombinase
MRAALYVRQSVSKDLGIALQLEATQALADARGWTVHPDHVFQDNDVSASKYRGAKTAWGRMLKAASAKEREFDVVVAVRLDRLLRSARDLVILYDTGVLVTTTQGDLDLTTPTGKMQAQMLAVLAEFEVDLKGQRQRETNAYRRTLGKAPGGRRAFGYTSSAAGHVPLEPEATAVREAYRDVTSNTLHSIARGWNDQGLTTTQGGQWDASNLRGVLLNPRNAALLTPPRAEKARSTTWDPDTLMEGDWDALVPRERFLEVAEYLRDPARRVATEHTERRLLSGIASCSLCGSTMKSSATGDRVRVYRCSSSGHLSIKAEPLDNYIEALIIARLEQPDAVALLAEAPTEQVEAKEAELRTLLDGKASLLRMRALGQISEEDVQDAVSHSQGRISALQAELAPAARKAVLAPLVAAEDVSSVWHSMSIEDRRAVLRILARVSIESPGRGSRATSIWRSTLFEWRSSV